MVTTNHHENTNNTNSDDSLVDESALHAHRSMDGSFSSALTTWDDEDGLSLSGSFGTVEPTYRQRIQRPLFGRDNELPTTVKEGGKCGGASLGGHDAELIRGAMLHNASCEEAWDASKDDLSTALPLPSSKSARGSNRKRKGEDQEWVQTCLLGENRCQQNYQKGEGGTKEGCKKDQKEGACE
jgi:hypothetical protein